MKDISALPVITVHPALFVPTGANIIGHIDLDRLYKHHQKVVVLTQKPRSLTPAPMAPRSMGGLGSFRSPEKREKAREDSATDKVARDKARDLRRLGDMALRSSMRGASGGGGGKKGR